MRTSKKDKQQMYYSLFSNSTVEYERDADGNIVYIEIDGEQVPVELGTLVESYQKPVPFKASISSSLNEMHIKSWGVDQSSIYSEIAVRKGYLPLEIGTIIWRTSAIKWKDETLGIPDASSADYTVCGLMDEDLYHDFYLLKRNSDAEKGKT